MAMQSQKKIFTVLEAHCSEGLDVYPGDLVQLEVKGAANKLRIGQIREATGSEAKKFNANKEAAARADATREAERVSIESRENAEAVAQRARDAQADVGA
jgi:hypothetical protein